MLAQAITCWILQYSETVLPSTQQELSSQMTIPTFANKKHWNTCDVVIAGTTWPIQWKHELATANHTQTVILDPLRRKVGLSLKCLIMYTVYGIQTDQDSPVSGPVNAGTWSLCSLPGSGAATVRLLSSRLGSPSSTSKTPAEQSHS